MFGWHVIVHLITFRSIFAHSTKKLVCWFGVECVFCHWLVVFGHHANIVVLHMDLKEFEVILKVFWQAILEKVQGRALRGMNWLCALYFSIINGYLGWVGVDTKVTCMEGSLWVGQQQCLAIITSTKPGYLSFRFIPMVFKNRIQLDLIHNCNSMNTKIRSNITFQKINIFWPILSWNQASANTKD